MATGAHTGYYRCDVTTSGMTSLVSEAVEVEVLGVGPWIDNMTTTRYPDYSKSAVFITGEQYRPLGCY